MHTAQKTTVATLTVLVMGLASLAASAQPHPGPQSKPGHPGGPMAQPAPRPAPVQVRPAPAPQRPSAQPSHAAPQPPHAAPQPPRPSAQRHGAGPDHQWNRGAKIPAQYRTQHYVVNDWQRHGLKRPARGQQWVQYGGDYMLVAIASGVIAELVLGR